jgi:ADP-ribose pyrophosphatase YjhB (NUDIX family)
MIYRFCPMCGSHLVDRELEGIARQVCAECGFIRYRHSSPCVGVLVMNGGKVLLVKRATEPYKGYWDIPGGFLEAGEHPAAGSVREIEEETGLAIEPTEILGVYVDVYGPEQEPTLNICYLARILGGEARAGSDAEELHWFPIDALPREIAFAWEAEALATLRHRLAGEAGKQ